MTSVNFEFALSFFYQVLEPEKSYEAMQKVLKSKMSKRGRQMPRKILPRLKVITTKLVKEK